MWKITRETEPPPGSGDPRYREERILILAPFGSDALLLGRVLQENGLPAEIRPDLDGLMKALGEGAGAILLSEEALTREARDRIDVHLRAQGPWSDLPILLVLSGAGGDPRGTRSDRRIQETTHLTVLTRPLQVAPFVSAARTAVQARKKQYQVRDELAARRLMAEALRENEERLRLAQEAARIGVFEWDLRDGTLIWSREMHRLLCEKEEAFQGSYVDWASRVHPEDLPGLESLFGKWLASSESHRSWEYRFFDPRGEERWMAARARLVRTADGKPRRMIGVNLDITEERRATEALRALNEELEERVRERTALLAASEAKYRGLVENTLDIPFSASTAGELLYVGPQVRRYGFEPDELTGLHYLQVIPREDRRRVGTEFRRFVRTGSPGTLEVRIRGADGGEHWLEARGEVQILAVDSEAAFTGALRDITLRKRESELRAKREDQLRALAARLASAQDVEQRRIADGLHDDVAQLLTACGVKLALADQAGDPEKARGLRDEAEALLEESIRKIQSLSFELYSSTLRRLGLRNALEELCQSVEQRYGVHFHFRARGEERSPEEALDTVLFKMVRELLFNVVKHAGVEEGEISLDLGKDYVELSVADEGAGFEAGEREPGLGQGLGLFGIRERVRDFGGSLQVRSIPGEGTRILIRIPAHPE